MAIIEEAVGSWRYLSISEALAETRKLGLPRRDKAATIVRADRDGGHRDKGY